MGQDLISKLMHFTGFLVWNVSSSTVQLVNAVSTTGQVCFVVSLVCFSCGRAAKQNQQATVVSWQQSTDVW